MLRSDLLLDHDIALGIEGHGADVRPVACGARPPRRLALSGLEVDRVARGQDGFVLSCMALLRADIANTAVAMLDVVPMHEGGRPTACGGLVGKAIDRELGARYLAVRNSDSTNALSSLTRGREYNEYRPHDSLGGVPPRQFMPRLTTQPAADYTFAVST